MHIHTYIHTQAEALNPTDPAIIISCVYICIYIHTYIHTQAEALNPSDPDIIFANAVLLRVCTCVRMYAYVCMYYIHTVGICHIKYLLHHSPVCMYVLYTYCRYMPYQISTPPFAKCIHSTHSITQYSQQMVRDMVRDVLHLHPDFTMSIYIYMCVCVCVCVCVSTYNV
jgi:hypothetical protein